MSAQRKFGCVVECGVLTPVLCVGGCGLAVLCCACPALITTRELLCGYTRVMKVDTGHGGHDFDLRTK